MSGKTSTVVTYKRRYISAAGETRYVLAQRYSHTPKKSTAMMPIVHIVARVL